MFDPVQESGHIFRDFGQCRTGRDMMAYENILRWCRVFLQGKSFTSYAGSETAFALLFPMERLFESCVAEKFRRFLDHGRYSLRTQDRTYCLFDRKFGLRPDIVVKDKQSGRIWILDTKWKLLSPDKWNYGISQADMYQMYAYGKKYHSDTITLVYPLNERVENLKQDISFNSGDGVEVRAAFVDMLHMDDSIRMLAEQYGAGNLKSL